MKTLNLFLLLHFAALALAFTKSNGDAASGISNSDDSSDSSSSNENPYYSHSDSEHQSDSSSSNESESFEDDLAPRRAEDIEDEENYANRLMTYLKIAQKSDDEISAILSQPDALTRDNLRNYRRSAEEYMSTVIRASEPSIVRRWMGTIGPESMCELSNFLHENVMPGIQMSEIVAILGENAPEDMLDGIEDLLMTINLAKSFSENHLNFFKVELRDNFWENILQGRAPFPTHGMEYRIKNMIAWEHHMLFTYDGTIRSRTIPALTKITSIEELARRGFLNLTWFHSRLAELRARVNDIDRQCDLTWIIHPNTDLTRGQNYHFIQSVWENILTDPTFNEAYSEENADSNT